MLNWKERLVQLEAWHSSGWTEKIHKNPFKTPDVPAKIQTEYLPNTSPERYIWTIAFGMRDIRNTSSS